jgi:hypothetical protein
VLSKLLLLVLLVLLFARFGFIKRLRNLKPQLDRAVNITIVVVAVAYAAQFLWWLAHR